MPFNVGLSSELSNGKDGFSWGEIAIDTLRPLDWKFLQPVNENFTPESVLGFDGVAFTAPGVIPGSFAAPEDSPLIISRFGVGYDNIDLDECTRAGVALTITPDASKKPVATAALTLVLATMHRLGAKQQLAKVNGWDRRIEGLGQGLTGKTVGTIGLGNIATEFFRLIKPFNVKMIAVDPWKTQTEADQFNVTLLDLNTLMSEADVVVVLATLTPETRHLINAANIALMKPNALLINMSRGPIVDEAALIAALQNGKIAGAGLDVFETEPTAFDNPLLSMENVIATPHNLAWTDELALGMGRSAFNAISMMSQGKIPAYVVNKKVLESPQFIKKLGRFK
jgi:phosphoglycerate dehydrogenase-like enzyme